ncbi:hypothetical protein NDN08_007057 [Rhodosorus marinus]|uniref:DUF1214 domain-containing protein n=1 Tax=Rhodosorus marinus TaxID=101924 RepID=A0AAV8UJH5_9RHOD|nr:hypothetical protein NDN08_007057 [Rhodosorus marinus]
MFTNNNLGYLIRDLVAVAYIAENCARGAVYFGGDKSTDGKPLNAKHNRMYTVTIPGNVPVKSTGYWSLTMYNSSNFMFVENSEEIYYYNIQNATPDEDCNYQFVMSYEQPVGPPFNAETWNWLPAPDGLFYTLTRVYAPESEISSGLYYPPGIEKVE